MANTSIGTAGFWEPHTSSMDFCEENYRFTIYVAELLNSASSLFIAAAGPWSWWLTPARYCTWPRFILCWLVFLVVGLGSVAFHATMRRPAQALDEVPMVLGNLVFIYCLSLPEGADKQLQLAMILVLVGFALVAVYVVWEAYIVFLSIYCSVVVWLCYASRLLCFGQAGKNGPELQRMWRLFVGTYMGGVVLWVADNLACSQLGVGHLHIAWHALASAGTVFFVLTLIALTADREGFEIKLGRRHLFMPCLQISGGSKSAKSGQTNGHEHRKDL